jgi:hypothetical protein
MIQDLIHILERADMEISAQVEIDEKEIAVLRIAEEASERD